MREPTADNDWALHREAVASVLTACLCMGCEPEAIQYEPGEPEEPCSSTIKGLVREIFAADLVWVYFKKGGEYVGKIVFTPYEYPDEVVCDYVGMAHPYGKLFMWRLDKWGDYNGY